jgi:choline-glycine betaine transporter
VNPGDTAPPVFNPAFLPLVITTAAVIGAVLFAPESVSAYAQGFSNRFVARWDLFYIHAINALALATFLIALSPLGRIRVGGPEARPEFSLISWIGMIFTSAMGGSLIGFSVYEPLEHLEHTRLLFGPGNAEQAHAVALAVFMWGFHGWGPWALLAAAFAYASYNRGAPFGFAGIAILLVPERSPRTRRFVGGAGDYAGVLASWLSGSVGIALICQQVAGGFIDRGGLATPVEALAPLVAAVMGASFIAIALTGLKDGIARISRLNFFLAHLYLAAVFLLSNPLALLGDLVSAFLVYFKVVVALPFLVTGTESEAVREFRRVWPASFMIWWLGMSVLLSAYYARISYGRTVREVLLVITVVPTALMAIWFAVMGGAAADMLERVPTLLDNLRPSQTVYAFVRELPVGAFFATFALALSLLFLLSTGAPIVYVFAEFMYESLATPSRRTVLFWGVAYGATITLVSGQSSVVAMQQLALSIAIPFSLLLLTLALALCVRGLRALRSPPGAA